MSSGTIRSRWLASMLGIAFGVSACGSNDNEVAPETANEPEASQAMPVKDSAFGDMAGTMDRARSVEATGMENKEAVDRAIEQDAGSAPAE